MAAGINDHRGSEYSKRIECSDHLFHNLKEILTNTRKFEITANNIQSAVNICIFKHTILAALFDILFILHLSTRNSSDSLLPFNLVVAPSMR